jgi:hypothetical protein
VSNTKIGTNELNGLVSFALRHHEMLEEEYGHLEEAAQQAGDLMLNQQAQINNLRGLLVAEAEAHMADKQALDRAQREIAALREQNQALTVVVRNGNTLAHHARVLNYELMANWQLIRSDVKLRLAKYSAELGNRCGTYARFVQQLQLPEA